MSSNEGKRVLAGITAGILILASGCGAKSSALQSENPVNITIWNYYTGAQLEEFNDLVKEFNATEGKKLGISVASSSEGSIVDLKDSVLAAAKKEVGTKALPNIFAAYTDTVYQMNDMELIEDISSYFNDKEKQEYIGSYLDEGDIDGNGSLKIFPVAKATEILMLNETDWEKFASESGADLSELSTMEGLTKVAEEYYQWTDSKTDTPDDGKAFFGRDAMANYMIIGAKQLGTDIFSTDETGNITVSFPEEVAKKLWDNYYVPFVNGYFSAAGRFRSDDVKTGNALCFVGSSSSASFFPTEVILSDEEKYPISVRVIEAPKFEDGADYAVQQGAGMAVVKASAAEVEASVEFLKWFTDESQNIRFSLASGYLPVKKAANQEDTIRKYDENSGEISEALKVSLDTVNSNEMYTLKGRDGSVRDILNTALSDQAEQDRNSVVESMAGGASRAEAVAPFVSEEHFESWYQATNRALTEVADSLNGEQ